MEWLAAAADRAGADPVRRLLSMFVLLDRWFHAKEFRGCPFVNTAIELGDRSDAVSVAAREHVEHNLRFFARLAREAGIRRPRRLARELLMLRDGAIVAALVGKDPKAGRRARRVAEVLVGEELSPDAA